MAEENLYFSYNPHIALCELVQGDFSLNILFFWTILLPYVCLF